MSISTTPNDTYTGYAKLITSKAKELGVKVAVVFFDESLVSGKIRAGTLLMTYLM